MYAEVLLIQSEPEESAMQASREILTSWDVEHYPAGIKRVNDGLEE